jgi:3D (Asp-Asp-Asp) domain-containing protein
MDAKQTRRVVGALICLAGVAAFAMAGRAEVRTATVKATAFNSTRAQTDGRPHETACGDHIAPGSRIIAVSRDLKSAGLDCGTEVHIAGLDGAWVVADVTAARHEQLIDIYMGRDIRAARQWGVQEVEIRWRER